MSFEDLTLKDSSSIAAAAYARDERTLRITFKPAEARWSRDSWTRSHMGQFINWRIKPNYCVREVT